MSCAESHIYIRRQRVKELWPEQRTAADCWSNTTILISDMADRTIERRSRQIPCRWRAQGRKKPV